MRTRTSHAYIYIYIYISPVYIYTAVAGHPRSQPHTHVSYIQFAFTYTQVLAGIRAHNAHIEELRRTYRRRAEEIKADNEMRRKRAEEEFEEAWKAFVELV